jgi:hypothetical protein
MPLNYHLLRFILPLTGFAWLCGQNTDVSVHGISQRKAMPMLLAGASARFGSSTKESKPVTNQRPGDVRFNPISDEKNGPR